MSSAILYLAIIAIWAGVLIPRWLKRDSSRAKEAQQAQDQPGDERTDIDADADADGGSVPMADNDTDADRIADPGPAGPQEPAAFRRPDPQALSILAARRRLLLVLAALSVAAVAIVLIGLAAWWVVVPPVVMLGGYLLLLREARRADAERAYVLAQAEYRDTQRRLREAREAARRREEAQTARVIHLAERARDEFYDQYEDGERRAVGH